MDGNSIMPFGKHKGKKLSDVPSGYFIYLFDRKQLKGELLKYAEENITQLKVMKENREKKDI